MNERFLALLLVIFSCLSLALIASTLALDHETHRFAYWLWVTTSCAALGAACGTGIKRFVALSQANDQ